MRKESMPHSPENLDGSSDIVYDWLLEMLKFDPDEEVVREKTRDYGWDHEAFRNYRDWVIDHYGTTDFQSIARQFMDVAPIWPRQDPSVTSPIGWWDRREREVLPPEHEEEEPAERHVENVVAWLRSSCFFCEAASRRQT